MAALTFRQRKECDDGSTRSIRAFETLDEFRYTSFSVAMSYRALTHTRRIAFVTLRNLKRRVAESVELWFLCALRASAL